MDVNSGLNGSWLSSRQVVNTRVNDSINLRGRTADVNGRPALPNRRRLDELTEDLNLPLLDVLLADNTQHALGE